MFVMPCHVMLLCQFARNLLVGLVSHDWDVTIISIDAAHADDIPIIASISVANTHTVYHMDPGYSDYSQITPDIFTLTHIVEPVDDIRFIHYMITSRHPDVILMIHIPTWHTHLAAWRRLTPHTLFVQYVDDADVHDDVHEQFHVVITPSEAIRDAAVKAGRKEEMVLLLQGWGRHVWHVMM